jgi:hypothetical protein
MREISAAEYAAQTARIEAEVMARKQHLASAVAESAPPSPELTELRAIREELRELRELLRSVIVPVPPRED